MKYTREVLEGPVRESKSIAEVMRRLGVKWNGGTQGNIKKRIELAGLDTSHFLGQARRRGERGRGKLHWSEILVKARSPFGKKENSAMLRRAMIESGIPHQCEKCGCPPEWQGKPLTLEVDHIDGDNLNNERHNVRFLCPNCHSQTGNYGAKNIGRMTDAGLEDIQMWSGEGNLAYLTDSDSVACGFETHPDYQQLLE